MIKHPFATVLCGSWLLFQSCEVTAGAEPPKAALSLSEVRAGLLDSQRLLRSVYVRYHIPYIQAGKGNLPPGAHLRRVMAVRGPYDFYLENAHGSDALDWRNDPAGTRSFATADRVITEWPVKRVYKSMRLPPERPFPRAMEGDSFILATGWWPPDCRRPPLRKEDGVPYVLAEIARSKDYVLRPVQERCGERWCHVLEKPGVDVLWIDTSHGFSLLARERWDSKSRALRQRIVLGDHREVSPGLWLPGWFEFIHYDAYAATPEARRQETLHSRAIIDEIRVNSIDDSVFAFKPSPGSAVLDDFTGEFEQTESGGLDYLESLAGRLKPRDPEGSAKPTLPEWLGWLSGVPALLVVGCCEILRRRRSSPNGELSRQQITRASVTPKEGDNCS